LSFSLLSRFVTRGRPPVLPILRDVKKIEISVHHEVLNTPEPVARATRVAGETRDHDRSNREQQAGATASSNRVHSGESVSDSANADTAGAGTVANAAFS
jgi:hypothetical protein